MFLFSAVKDSLELTCVSRLLVCGAVGLRNWSLELCFVMCAWIACLVVLLGFVFGEVLYCNFAF